MSAFQPPPDYTRREVEAARAPSCPFYGASLIPASVPIHGGFLVRMDGVPGCNRCALITSAHSPCWMEVAESRAPDWSQCPRNPEYAAANIWRGDFDADEEARQDEATIRIVAALKHLNRLMNIRRLAAVPAGKDLPL